MGTGDERLESVGETIEEAKKAADKVSDQENLDLGHRERPDPTAEHGASDDEAEAEAEADEDKADEDSNEEIDDQRAADGDVK